MPNVHNAANLSLAPIEGCILIISGAADSNYGTTATAAYAYAEQYNVQNIATISEGKMVNDDSTEATLMSISASHSGVGVAYKLHIDTTAICIDIDTDRTTMRATDALGNSMLAVESMKAESASVVSSDELTFDAHHTVASGIVAFVEHTDDEKTDSKLMKKQLQLVFHSSS